MILTGGTARGGPSASVGEKKRWRKRQTSEPKAKKRSLREGRERLSRAVERHAMRSPIFTKKGRGQFPTNEEYDIGLWREDRRKRSGNPNGPRGGCRKEVSWGIGNPTQMKRDFQIK